MAKIFTPNFVKLAKAAACARALPPPLLAGRTPDSRPNSARICSSHQHFMSPPPPLCFFGTDAHVFRPQTAHAFRLQAAFRGVSTRSRRTAPHCPAGGGKRRGVFKHLSRGVTNVSGCAVPEQRASQKPPPAAPPQSSVCDKKAPALLAVCRHATPQFSAAIHAADCTGPMAEALRPFAAFLIF